MRIAIYKYTCAKNGIPIMDALIDYLKPNAIIAPKNKVIDADVAVIWSVVFTNSYRKYVWEECHRLNIPVVVLEVGGLIRNKSWKMAIDGINAEATFLHHGSPSGRLGRFGFKIEPWKRNDGPIIICGQCQDCYTLRHINIDTWIQDTIIEIRKHTDRPIIIRPHPRGPLTQEYNFHNVSIVEPKFSSIETDAIAYSDLDETIKDAYAVINYNSTPAISAAFMGLPLFTDKSSLCWEVSQPNLSYITNPAAPDREQWANDIVYTEWFEDEIGNGIPWERLKEHLQELTLFRKVYH